MLRHIVKMALYKCRSLLALLIVFSLHTDITISADEVANVTSQLALLRAERCECTRTGSSGVNYITTDANTTRMVLADNTTFVGCAKHVNGELDGIDNTCYVVGGTECANATSSILGDTTPAFEKAAWRRCNPSQTSFLTSKMSIPPWETCYEQVYTPCTTHGATCFPWRGPTTCINGDMCLCDYGYCANVDGVCAWGGQLVFNYDYDFIDTIG